MILPACSCDFTYIFSNSGIQFLLLQCFFRENNGTYTLLCAVLVHTTDASFGASLSKIVLSFSHCL